VQALGSAFGRSAAADRRVVREAVAEDNVIAEGVPEGYNH